MRFKFYSLIVAAAGLIALSACSKDPDTDDGGETPPGVKSSISVGQKTLSFVAENAPTQTVSVTASSDEWFVETTKNTAWLSAVAKTTETGKALIVGVNNNSDFDARSAYVYVRLDDVSDSILVTQIGLTPALTITEEKYEITADAQTVSVDVTTNVDYDVTFSESCDWITYDVTENGMKLVLSVSENPNYEARTATVTLLSEENELEVSFEVEQAAAQERVRQTEDIFIPFETATTASSASTYPVENINDNNLSTFWQTPSRGVASPAEITFNFGSTLVTRLDYMVYYPSTPYGQFGEVDVYYTTGAGVETFVCTHDFRMSDAPDTVRFGEEGISQVQTVTLKIKTANGRESSTGVLAGIAELEFFRTPILRETLEIFTDYSCSELRPEVTLKDAENIPDELMRTIAVGLINGSYDTEFRVATYNAYPHPDEDGAAFGTNTYTKWDNITGMCVTKAGTYHVAVDTDPSATVYIDVINWEKNCYGYNCAFQLKKGINTIEIPEKNGNYQLIPGMIYLRYHTPNYTTATPIKVHFMDAEVNGYFDTHKTDPSRFETLLENAKAPEFDIKGLRTIVTMPVTKFQTNTRTGERAQKLLAITDTIVALEEDLQGHNKYNTGGHRNRMIMRPIYPTRDADGNITSAGSYMYSTSYATGYNVGNDAVNAVTDPDKLSSGIWGPAHEIGHSNQIARGLKWAGTTEVTNNICSAYVMYTLNGAKEKNAKTSLTDRDAFNYGIRDIALNPDETVTHFSAGSWDNMYYEKVVPFWQLYLYYTYVGGYPDLYKDVYHNIRNRTDNKTIAHGQAQLNFITLVSDLTKTDLTEFFEFWRMLTPTSGVYISDYGRVTMTITQAMIDEVKQHMSQYPKPAHKIQFICEHNIDLFVNPATEPVAGTMTVSTSSVGARGFTGFVAFELCDGPDKPVAYFLPKTTTTTGATMYNRYSTIIWKDASGNKSPNNVNSTTYYCSEQSLTTVPSANYTPYVYGILASGERIPATNNPE